MGSYGQDEDLDEYEDDFIDDQDGDGGVGVGVGRSKYYDDEGEDEYGDDDESEEEVEEEKVSEDTLKLLKYRQKIKEELRYKLRKENGGSQSRSIDQGRKAPMNNFGSFFGPSQPVIADRVFQESKALMETRHLAPKPSTSQNNVKKVNMPSVSGVKNGVKNGVIRPPPPSQFKSKAQTMKDTRDYSFLLSDDADIPKPSKPGFLISSRPAQVPAQSNRPSGHSGGKVMSVNERRKPHEIPQVSSSRAAPGQKLTSDNRPGVSSDSRRQADLKGRPQVTKNHSSNGGSGSMRPPLARPLPSSIPPSSSADRRMPSSSTDRRMPSSSTDRRMPPSSTNGRMPSSSADRRIPPSSADKRIPPSSADRRMPPSSTDRRMPPSSTDRRMPSSSADRRMPSSSADRRMPSSSADRRMPSLSADRRVPSSSADRKMPSSSADRRMPSSSTDRRMPPSSADRKMPMDKKATASSVGDRRLVSKQSLANGQRMPAERPRSAGLPRPQDRSMSVQHSRDNRAFKENGTTSRKQMNPPKQSSLRPPNLDRDHARVQKPNGQSRVHSQSSGIRKDSNSRKRKSPEVDDDDGYDFRSAIRKMFKYDASKYVEYDDDDDDMCMEAGFDAIQQEEKRSARIARQEDEEELAKILEEEKQERLRKKAKMRKMSQR